MMYAWSVLQECKVEKAVGAPTEEVLFIFDDANPIDPLSLASLIQVRFRPRP